MRVRYIVKAELLAGRESASLTQHSIWLLLGHGIIDANTAIRPVAVEQWHKISDYFNLQEIPAKIAESIPNRELALKSAYRTSLYSLFRKELRWQGVPEVFLADDSKLVLYRSAVNDILLPGVHWKWRLREDPEQDRRLREVGISAADKAASIGSNDGWEWSRAEALIEERHREICETIPERLFTVAVLTRWFNRSSERQTYAYKELTQTHTLRFVGFLDQNFPEWRKSPQTSTDYGPYIPLVLPELRFKKWTPEVTVAGLDAVNELRAKCGEQALPNTQFPPLPPPQAQGRRSQKPPSAPVSTARGCFGLILVLVSFLIIGMWNWRHLTQPRVLLRSSQECPSP